MFFVGMHLCFCFDPYLNEWFLQSKLVNCAAHRKPEVCTQVQTHLKHLHVLLGLIVTFAEGILSEFLDAHETVSISDLIHQPSSISFFLNIC